MISNKDNKRKLILGAVTVSLCLLIAAVSLAVYLGKDQQTIAANAGYISSTGQLQIEVVDGFSEVPIQEATVVIPEISEAYITDEYGMTQMITVPIIKDARFDNIMQKPWGEVTLIIYKPGYMPYALFYLQVMEGQVRKGVKILLFEDGSTDSTEPFSIIEGPHRVWVNEVIKKYQP